MRTPQEMLDLVQAAAAYDIVMQSADGDENVYDLPPQFAGMLRLLLTDSNAREAAAQAWADLFQHSGKTTAARASELLREIEEWLTTHRQPEWRFASDTDDTPPTSKTN